MPQNVEEQPRPKSFWKAMMAPLAVAIVAFAVYFPTLEFGWTDTDDISLIREDSVFLTSTGTIGKAFGRPFFPGGGEQKSYYRPLVTGSFLFDAGNGAPPAPLPYHKTNALLHACAAVLVYVFARAFTNRSLVAVAAAACFAVHPAAAQSVAWVPGRSDSLMGVFALASIVAYLRYDESNSRVWLGAHLLGFAAALFAKESAIAIVPIVTSFSLWISRHPLRLKVPALLIGWLLVTSLWLVARQAALGTVTSGARFSSILHNLPMLWISLGKALLPADLQVLATLQDAALWPGAVAVLLLVLAFLFVKADMRRLLIWTAVAIPFCMLAPALLVDNELVLDNRLYVPLAGLTVGAAVVADSRVVTARARQVSVLAIIVLCGVFARSTLRYSLAFSSPRAFCEAAVRGSPHLPLAHVNLGSTEFRAGNLEAAEEQFRTAISLDSRWPVAHNNLGLVYMNRGQVDAAEAEFTAELSNNPDYPKAHFNLGLVLMSTKREVPALMHFERVVELVPTDVSAWGELLKYYGPRDSARATQIMLTMENLGVTFHSPDSK